VADWLRENYGLVVPLLLGAVAVWLLMPRLPYERSFRMAGGVAGVAALVTAGLWLTHPGEGATRALLFYLFATGAIAGAAMMITDRHPVYSALWFALATLCVCGLFLLRSAPFLAAATVIVYAGAIIVTFLFVIMLAQQHGSAIYDQRAVRPFPAVFLGFAILGGMLFTIQEWRDSGRDSGDEAVIDTRFIGSPVSADANPLSRPVENAELGTMRGLGRSLFGDYLFAVEVAGTLLLVAAIGAIALAPRRSQGTL
jgi:NADH-quinone oxidoreductase subunit J